MPDTSTIILCSAAFLYAVHLIVIMLFAWGGIFRKAGYHPAMLFIPVYGIFLCYKIAESEKLFIWQLVIAFIAYLAYEVIVGPYTISHKEYPDGAVIALLILGAVVGTLFLIINIICSIRLSRLFGKGGRAAAGFLFIFPVFFSILGFGDAKYIGYGGRQTHDLLAENAVWVCPECGEKIPAHISTCACGTVKPVKTGRDEAA